MARFSVVLFITVVLVIVQSSSAEETCQSIGGTCKGPLWSNVKCDGQERFPMAGCGASSVCCLPTKRATVKTCAASCGICSTTQTSSFCSGFKVPASDCNGPTEFCCVRAWIGPSTCQDMGGTCKGPVWSGIQCNGELTYGTPGCPANEWCCMPKQRTTPELKTIKTTVKTCAASCGNCLTTKTTPFCAGYKVPASDCNGPTEFCCVRAWIGPSTCQDMGGTCMVPVSSGIRCDGLLKYDTPGCAAGEWCCAPDQTTTPEPKTTTKKEKTCASACGRCQSNKYGCQGFAVPDVTDCNQANEGCCVPYWAGPCPGK